MTFFWFIILFTLLTITMISILNAFTLPRLKGGKPNHFYPLSILLPARNEAHIIGETIKSLGAQTYPGFKLILLDDQSEDGTGVQAQEAAGSDHPLCLIQGTELPRNWTGKNWACHQLANSAQGEVIVFTDADVQWEPQALSALIKLTENENADLLTIWPTQISQTWSERLVVPLMMFAITAYLPELAVRRLPWSVFAAANGQCLVFRRDAYDIIGGHQNVKNEIVEDVALAKAIKRKHLRLVMGLGEDLIKSRMYTNWREVREGFAKNILAGHCNRPIILLLSTLFHWCVFLLPWVWLLTGRWVDVGPYWPWFPVTLILLGIGSRALSAAITHQRIKDAWWMPVSVIFMTIIAVQSIWWHYTGGPKWKGRQLPHITLPESGS